MLNIHVVYQCSLPDVGSTSNEYLFLVRISQGLFLIYSYFFKPRLRLDFKYFVLVSLTR